jgi:hypothetical protein
LPFLKELHDRLVPLLEARGIGVAALDERQWCQRYTFTRQDEIAVVDIVYDRKNRITKCMPPRLAAFSSASREHAKSWGRSRGR